MIKILVTGACGRMGKMNVLSVSKGTSTILSGAVERSGHPDLGKDIGEIAGIGKSLEVFVSDKFENELQKADVVIDFTSPKATMEFLEINKSFKKGFVIGTTGFSEEETNKLEEYSKEFPMVLSPNYSIGVNLLFKLTEIVSGILTVEKDYDCEIVEAHHRFKKDSPSGTAKKILEIAAKHSGRDAQKNAIYGRQGLIGERDINEIGVFSVRGGDIIGEHTISFTTLGERVELTHKAHSRDTFSKGTVTASLFISEKQSGLYSMFDVLGF